MEVWRSAVAVRPGQGLGRVVDAHDRPPAGRRPGAQRTGRADRLRKAATARGRPYDDVVEQATARIERQQVRRCINGLTELQREAIILAYYSGHTYREVAELLDTPLPTIKTRMRDGLIRLRDCLGVTAMTTMSDIHALAGAYALDAVDDIERAAFERHLRECDSCALEVAELRETASRLADSVAVEPPPGLRASVLDAGLPHAAGPRRARPRRNPAASSAQRWRRFAAASVAAGVIAVGIGAGTWTVANRNVDDARRVAPWPRLGPRRSKRVLAAPDARCSRARAAAAGRST